MSADRLYSFLRQSSIAGPDSLLGLTIGNCPRFICSLKVQESDRLKRPKGDASSDPSSSV